MTKTTTVISHYAARDQLDLRNLIDDLKRFSVEIIVIVNDDRVLSDTFSESLGIKFITRPNTGMNIGGWSSAIKYCVDFDQIIFLQDECRLNNENFIDCYAEKLSIPNIGMVGETINYKWNLSWENLFYSRLNYRVSLQNGQHTDRVSFYLSCLKKWGLSPGQSGLHLRALVWGFSSRLIPSIISSFPEGSSKEECIASEIAVTKQVEQLGMDICQSDQLPFKYFTHKEWKKDGSSKA